MRIFTDPHLARIRVVFFRLDASVVDDVAKGRLDEAAVAAAVAVLARAVHQVLGAQVNQVARDPGQLAL